MGEEAELSAIQCRQMEFEQMRNAELVEVQRLDAEASRRFAEKQRRITQEADRLRQQAELGQKIAARAFARSYLANLSELALHTPHIIHRPSAGPKEDLLEKLI